MEKQATQVEGKRVLPQINPEDILQDPSEYADSTEKSHRQTASATRLVLDAIGPPSVWLPKFGRFAHSLFMLINFPEVSRRLRRLQSRGLIEKIPTRMQIFVGGMDMQRYYIAAGARAYYASRGIGFHFHNLLKILDDPASVADPTGIRVPRDSIIGHVLHVVHANPIYDFQLLEMFEDGMEEMEKQTRQILDGNHPRQQTINAIVEDPEYHGRLLDYIVAYRKDNSAPMLHRRHPDAVREDRDAVLCLAQFGALDGAFRYMNRLPADPFALLKHWLNEKKINRKYFDPEIIEAEERILAKTAKDFN